MVNLLTARKSGFSFKFMCFFLSLAIGLSSLSYLMFANQKASYADVFNRSLENITSIVKPVSLGVNDNLPVLKGINFDSKNPFSLQFYLDRQDKKVVNKQDLHRMVKYFLGFLAIPQDKLWVNLSPYESNRIIPDCLADLDIGKDLLLEDYLLKQLTASLTDPKTSQGRKFWDRVNSLVYKLTKTNKIAVNAFNKVWIVPDKILVYQAGNQAIIKEATLKVMLEEDFLAVSQYKSIRVTKFEGKINKEIKEIFKQEILPIIEKEVNQGASFAPLRQLFNSLVLATYFKETLAKHPFYQHYFNQEKARPIALPNKEAKKVIYNNYVKSVKNGMYNSLHKEYDPNTKEKIQRKYFSGGLQIGFSYNQAGNSEKQIKTVSAGELASQREGLDPLKVTVSGEQKEGKDKTITLFANPFEKILQGIWQKIKGLFISEDKKNIDKFKKDISNKAYIFAYADIKSLGMSKNEKILANPYVWDYLKDLLKGAYKNAAIEAIGLRLQHRVKDSLVNHKLNLIESTIGFTSNVTKFAAFIIAPVIVAISPFVFVNSFLVIAMTFAVSSFVINFFNYILGNEVKSGILMLTSFAQGIWFIFGAPYGFFFTLTAINLLSHVVFYLADVVKKTAVKISQASKAAKLELQEYKAIKQLKSILVSKPKPETQKIVIQALINAGEINYLIEIISKDISLCDSFIEALGVKAFQEILTPEQEDNLLNIFRKILTNDAAEMQQRNIAFKVLRKFKDVEMIRKMLDNHNPIIRRKAVLALADDLKDKEDQLNPLLIRMISKDKDVNVLLAVLDIFKKKIEEDSKELETYKSKWLAYVKHWWALSKKYSAIDKKMKRFFRENKENKTLAIIAGKIINKLEEFALSKIIRLVKGFVNRKLKEQKVWPRLQKLEFDVRSKWVAGLDEQMSKDVLGKTSNNLLEKPVDIVKDASKDKNKRLEALGKLYIEAEVSDLSNLLLLNNYSQDKDLEQIQDKSIEHLSKLREFDKLKTLVINEEINLDIKLKNKIIDLLISDDRVNDFLPIIDNPKQSLDLKLYILLALSNKGLLLTYKDWLKAKSKIIEEFIFTQADRKVENIKDILVILSRLGNIEQLRKILEANKSQSNDLIAAVKALKEIDQQLVFNYRKGFIRCTWLIAKDLASILKGGIFVFAGNLSVLGKSLISLAKDVWGLLVDSLAIFSAKERRMVRILNKIFIAEITKDESPITKDLIVYLVESRHIAVFKNINNDNFIDVLDNLNNIIKNKELNQQAYAYLTDNINGWLLGKLVDEKKTAIMNFLKNINRNQLVVKEFNQIPNSQAKILAMDNFSDNLDFLIRQLRNQEEKISVKAIELLSGYYASHENIKAEKDKIIKVLLEMLKDKRSKVRYQAALSLLRLFFNSLEIELKNKVLGGINIGVENRDMAILQAKMDFFNNDLQKKDRQRFIVEVQDFLEPLLRTNETDQVFNFAFSNLFNIKIRKVIKDRGAAQRIEEISCPIVLDILNGRHQRQQRQVTALKLAFGLASEQSQKDGYLAELKKLLRDEQLGHQALDTLLEIKPKNLEEELLNSPEIKDRINGLYFVVRAHKYRYIIDKLDSLRKTEKDPQVLAAIYKLLSENLDKVRDTILSWNFRDQLLKDLEQETTLNQAKIEALTTLGYIFEAFKSGVSNTSENVQLDVLNYFASYFIRYSVKKIAGFRTAKKISKILINMRQDASKNYNRVKVEWIDKILSRIGYKQLTDLEEKRELIEKLKSYVDRFGVQSIYIDRRSSNEIAAITSLLEKINNRCVSKEINKEEARDILYIINYLIKNKIYLKENIDNIAIDNLFTNALRVLIALNETFEIELMLYDPEKVDNSVKKIIVRLLGEWGKGLKFESLLKGLLKDKDIKDTEGLKLEIVSSLINLGEADYIIGVLISKNPKRRINLKLTKEIYSEIFFKASNKNLIKLLQLTDDRVAFTTIADKFIEDLKKNKNVEDKSALRLAALGAINDRARTNISFKTKAVEILMALGCIKDLTTLLGFNIVEVVEKVQEELVKVTDDEKSVRNILKQVFSNLKKEEMVVNSNISYIENDFKRDPRQPLTEDEIQTAVDSSSLSSYLMFLKQFIKGNKNILSRGQKKYLRNLRDKQLPIEVKIVIDNILGDENMKALAVDEDKEEGDEDFISTLPRNIEVEDGTGTSEIPLTEDYQALKYPGLAKNNPQTQTLDYAAIIASGQKEAGTAQLAIVENKEIKEVTAIVISQVDADLLKAPARRFNYQGQWYVAVANNNDLEFAKEHEQIESEIVAAFTIKGLKNMLVMNKTISADRAAHILAWYRQIALNRDKSSRAFTNLIQMMKEDPNLQANIDDIIKETDRNLQHRVLKEALKLGIVTQDSMPTIENIMAFEADCQNTAVNGGIYLARDAMNIKVVKNTNIDKQLNGLSSDIDRQELARNIAELNQAKGLYYQIDLTNVDFVVK